MDETGNKISLPVEEHTSASDENLTGKQSQSDFVTTDKFAAFQKSTTQQIADQTSIFGVSTSDILVGSVVVELFLLLLIFCVANRLSSAQNRSSRVIDKQKEKIEELTRKVERLERNAAQPKPLVTTNWPAPPKPAPEIKNFIEPSPIERPPAPSPTERPTVPPPTTEDKYKDFVKDFNALVGQSGINLKNARNDFLRKYNVQTFTCTNFEARMNEPVPAPIFDSANSLATPDYWAYEFESGIFAVVPNVKIYSDNHHTARAMGEVFQSNFTAGRTYNKIRVNRPAIFKGMWNFEKQGELELS